MTFGIKYKRREQLNLTWRTRATPKKSQFTIWIQINH